MEHKSRLVAYAPNGAKLGPLPWPLEFSATVPTGELGAASLTYSRAAVGGGLLQRTLTQGLEVALEEWDGAAWVEPRGGRFIAVERSFDPSDRTDTVSLTCPAYGWVLAKIKHAAPSESLYSSAEGENQGRRQFLGVNAGTVIKTLRDEYVARGGYAIELGFTTATDSNGVAWPSLNAFWVSRGEALDVTLARLYDGGAVDWWWQGRTLHMAPPSAGRERGSVVILRAGREIAEAASTETIADLISAQTLHGGDGVLVTTTEPTAPTPWGRWEGFASDDRVTLAASATARNQQVLAEAGRLRGQYTRDLTPLNPHRLGIDILPGDWISATTTSATSTERVRVASLLWRAGSQGVTRSLILNDSLLDRELRRQRRERIGSDAGSNGSGSTVRPAPEGIDKRILAAPTGLAVSTQAYLDNNGVARGLITASWNAVTAARVADGGGSMEVSGYQLAIRRNVVGAPWAVVRETDDTTVDHAPLTVGESIQVRVRARGRYAYYLGEWSAPVTLTVASDTTPPPVPSAPIVSARLGVVQVEWNGLAAGGGSGIPIDFARVEVAVGTTSLPTTVRGQILRAGGMAHINGLPYNTPHWVRLRAVDQSGNASAWSTAVQTSVTPLVDADLIGSTVDSRIDAAQDAADQALIDASSSTFIDRLYSSRIIVDGTENLIRDAQFLDADINAYRIGIATGGTWTNGTDTDSTTLLGTNYLMCTRGAGTDVAARLRLHHWDAEPTPWVQVTPGETLAVSFRWRVRGTTPASPTSVRPLAYWGGPGGTTTEAPSFTVYSGTGSSAWQPTVSWQLTVPANVTELRMAVDVVLNHESIQIAKPMMRRGIGPVLIEDGAITAPKLFADLAMANRLAGVFADFGTTRTNWLQADHIDAGSFRGYVVEGADIISNLSSGALDYIRMKDRTLTVGRDDGEGGSLVTAQFGGPTSDKMVLRNSSGQTQALFDAATGDGSVTNRMSVGELVVGGETLDEILARLPKGILAIHKSAGNSDVAGSAQLGYVTSGNLTISTERMYRIAITGIIAAKTAGDRVRVWLKTYDATNGTVYRQMGQMVIPTGTGDTIHVETTLRGWVNGVSSAYVTFQNATANRGVFWSGRVNYPTTFVVQDVGLAANVQMGSFNSQGGTPLSGGTVTNETGSLPVTREYAATWQRSWRGSTIVSDFLHHGYYGGYQRYSMVGFGGSLATDLSGKTIHKVEALVDNESWWGSSGTILVGSSTYTSAPASPVTTGTTAATAMTEGQQRWVPVGGFTTSSRAITLGVGAGTGTGYYGKFRYSGVKLRVTYS